MVIAPNRPHFLQSEPWEQFQQSLGKKTYRRSGDGWSYLAILETGTANRRLYCPYGPTADTTDSLNQALVSLAKLGRELNASFLRIEPTDPHFRDFLKKSNWRPLTYQSLNPEHTSIVDLSPPLEEIISRMNATNRNLYRNYAKKGLSLHTSSDPQSISIFLDMIHQVSNRTGMKPHPDQYFIDQANCLFPRGSARLMYVNYNNQPVASTIVYEHDGVCYYAHAGALSEFRRLNPGNVLLAHVITDAKQRGCMAVDLYGIAPDDAKNNHPWRGFTAFKRGFGGTDTSFAGTWEKPLNPLTYWLYRLYQQLRKIV